jgi:hypothetical protein
MVEGGRIKGREYRIKIEGGGREEAIADRMTIVPIEAGNLIRLTKGDFMVREIPIGTVESIDAVSEPEKGLLGDRDNNRKLILSYSDGVSHSLTIDVVDDGEADEIVQEINTLKDIEADYFQASKFEYREGEDRWVRSRFYVRTPFLAQGEKVLWKEEDMEGFISKRYKWVKAVTNIRALYYEFDTHKSTFITLPIIEDVVVTDKRVESSSQHQAMAYTFRPSSGPYSLSNVHGNTQTTSVTIGDVLIMYRGRPVIRLNSVEDPDGVAELVRAAVKESLVNLREVAGPHAEESRPASPAGPSCDSHNLAGARFCNQCGPQI